MRRSLWLLSCLALRGWRRHPVRQSLAVLSIALGVAMYLSTEATSSAITRSVERAVAAVDAGIDLTVARDAAGVTAAEVAALAERPEFAGASGVVSVPAVHASGAELTLLGLDPRADRTVRRLHQDVRLAAGDAATFLLDPGAIVLTRPFLAEVGLAVGDTILLETAAGRREFRVAGVLEVPAELAHAAARVGFLPLGRAQETFGLGDRVHRVDLRLAPDVSLAGGVAAARAVVGPGAAIRTPAERAAERTAPLVLFRGLFRVNGLLALVIAVFFVFNTVSASIAERTRDAGLWRALGMTRRGLLVLLLAEAGVLGLLGFALGIGLGFGIARVTLERTAAVIDTIHFPVPPGTELELPAGLVAAAAALALGAALVATLVAGAGLASRLPLEVMERQGRTRRRRRGFVVGAAAGGLLLALCAGFAADAFPALQDIAGRATTLLLPLGVALIAPGAVLALSALLRRVTFRRCRPPVWLALDAIRDQPSRSALTITAFALSLGLVIGHGSTVRGMHGTLADWLRRSIPGDVVIGGRQDTPLAGFAFREEALEPLATMPGVDRVFRLRFGRLRVGATSTMVVAMDVAAAAGRTQYCFVAGDGAEALARTAAGEAVLVAENLAWRQGLAVGDRIAIPAATGVVDLEVAGILRDYHDPAGAVFLDLELYRRLFGDPLLDYMELIGAEGTDPGVLAARARTRLPADHAFLSVLAKPAFVTIALGFVEDLRKLSLIQLVLAILIGAAGILVTTTLSIVARTRELSLLQAIGMDQGALRATVALEVLILATASAGAGAAIGMLFFIPANLVFRELSGFVFEPVVPFAETLWAIAIAYATALLAMVPSLRHLKAQDLLREIERD